MLRLVISLSNLNFYLKFGYEVKEITPLYKGITPLYKGITPLYKGSGQSKRLAKHCVKSTV